MAREHNQSIRNSTMVSGGREVQVGNPAGYSPSGEPLWHTSEGRMAECLMRPVEERIPNRVGTDAAGADLYTHDSEDALIERGIAYWADAEGLHAKV